MKSALDGLTGCVCAEAEKVMAGSSVMIFFAHQQFVLAKKAFAIMGGAETAPSSTYKVPHPLSLARSLYLVSPVG